MDDGNAGPVIYVSYRAFSPRAKDILARPLAALAPGFGLRRTGTRSCITPCGRRLTRPNPCDPPPPVLGHPTHPYQPPCWPLEGNLERL
jgi:hypothetical protein